MQSRTSRTFLFDDLHWQKWKCLKFSVCCAPLSEPPFHFLTKCMKHNASKNPTERRSSWLAKSQITRERHPRPKCWGSRADAVKLPVKPEQLRYSVKALLEISPEIERRFAKSDSVRRMMLTGTMQQWAKDCGQKWRSRGHYPLQQDLAKNTARRPTLCTQNRATCGKKLKPCHKNAGSERRFCSADIADVEKDVLRDSQSTFLILETQKVIFIVR